VGLIETGAVLNNAAKEVLVEMFKTGDAPAAIIERKGLKAGPTDTAELEQWCREAIVGNAKAAAEFKGGKDSAINAFKGPVMKASRGKANPKLVDEVLRRLLAES
jgi:aspartyl-tRNA(Asn)/glutamyl-tRNA(Gln) amidotransferase subunit B